MRRLGSCCNCTTPTPEPGFCGCGTCRQAASLTIGAISVPQQSVSAATGQLFSQLIQMYDGGTIEFNEPSIGQSGVLSCYYGDATTDSLDDTMWGISPFTSTTNGTCWQGQNAFDFDHGYYFGANVRVYHIYNDGQRSYLTVRVTPKFTAFFNGSAFVKGSAVAADNAFSTSFDIEADFTYGGPYKECEGPAYSTAEEVCHGAVTASLNYTDPKPSLCDCWSNENGGGCQFDSESPFSNLVLDLDGQATNTQNGASYWEIDPSVGPRIVVPMTTGDDLHFYHVPESGGMLDPDNPGTGKYLSLGEYNTAGSQVYLLDACEGNIQGTGVTNPNDTFTVDVTGGSDCE